MSKHRSPSCMIRGQLRAEATVKRLDSMQIPYSVHNMAKHYVILTSNGTVISVWPTTDRWYVDGGMPEGYDKTNIEDFFRYLEFLKALGEL